MNENIPCLFGKSIRGSILPVDIVALRDEMDMLVQVISSKHPILDAKTLFRRYKKKIDALRLMGTASRFRKVLRRIPCPVGGSITMCCGAV